jgi:hypothetical protein
MFSHIIVGHSLKSAVDSSSSAPREIHDSKSKTKAKFGRKHWLLTQPLRILQRKVTSVLHLLKKAMLQVTYVVPKL